MIQILFDNGDCLDGVHSLDVFTEDQVIKCFPFSKQVQLRRQLNSHNLLGKGFMREWVNLLGQRRVVYGTITKCWQGLADGNEKFFTVEYDDGCVNLLERIPAADNAVSEASAWGGYVAFKHALFSSQPITLEPPPPFYWNWIVPATTMLVAGNPYPSLVMFVGGFELRFMVQESSIPDSGLGVWITCTRASSLLAHQAEFVLPPGHLVDLSVYGPLQNEDLKSEAVFLMKDFIHLGTIKPWSFERASHESGFIDMTDDWSGEIHQQASNNIISYMNETCRNDEHPTVCALHDPAGAIHYLLGHNYACYGALTIPVGEAIELKVSSLSVVLISILTHYC